MMRWIEANGLRLRATVKGDGTPLLALSGTTAELRRTPTILDTALADRFRIVSYDQRGLGESDKPDGPYSIADYAEDARGVMAALGWERAHVLGVSFGGMVAQELAIRHPALIDRLALCCTSPGGAGGASYPLHALGHLSPEERARHMIPLWDTRRDARWAAADPERHAALVRSIAEDPFAGEPRRAEGRALQLDARARHDAWDRLGTITAPTLVCGGLHDGVAPPDVQRRLAGAIPGAELRFFEGGHMFVQTNPEAIDAIIAFLEEGE